MSVSGDDESNANDEHLEGDDPEIHAGAVRISMKVEQDGRNRRINVYFNPDQVKNVDGSTFIHIDTRLYHVRRILTCKIQFPSGSKRNEFMNQVMKSTDIVERLVADKNDVRMSLITTGGTSNASTVKCQRPERQKRFVKNRLQMARVIDITTDSVGDVDGISMTVLNTSKKTKSIWIEATPSVIKWLSNATAAQYAAGGVTKPMRPSGDAVEADDNESSGDGESQHETPHAADDNVLADDVVAEVPDTHTPSKLPRVDIPTPSPTTQTKMTSFFKSVK